MQMHDVPVNAAKEMAQHGYSLVVYRSLSSTCFLRAVVDRDCGCLQRRARRLLCAAVGQELDFGG